MDIEKEISSRFDNEYQKSIVNLIYTHGLIINVLKKKLDKHDITYQQFNILRILRGQNPKPSTINLLKERMLDKMSDASRIVERLVQKGMVTRRTNKADRRSVDILITDKGLNILDALNLDAYIKELLHQNISPAEASQLSSLLDKMRG